MIKLRIAIQMDPLNKLHLESDSSLILAKEAQNRNHKIFIYEPNLVLGRVNRFFVRNCEKIFTNSENIINFPKQYLTKIIKVGNILREEILKYKSFNKNYLESKKTIFVLGGSQGASVFGEIVPNAIIELAKKQKTYRELLPNTSISKI